MAISKRQFKLLSEMEIPLWVPKSAASSKVISDTSVAQTAIVEKNAPSEASKTPINNEQQATFLAVELKNTALFSDILLSLGTTRDNALTHKDHITIANLTWQFSAIPTVSYQDGKLVTPSLEALSNSPALKRQLWQLINLHKLHNLSC